MNADMTEDLISQLSITTLVSTCDAYRDLWNVFDFYYEKNGPHNPCLLVTDRPYNETRIGNIELFAPSSALEFSDRVRLALETIHTEYVLFLLDDFAITKPVDLSLMQEALWQIKTNRIDYLRLSKGTKLPLGKHLSKHIKEMNLKKPYDADVHAFIIRTDTFKHLLTVSNERIWNFEPVMSKRLFEAKARCAYMSPAFIRTTELVTKGCFFRFRYHFVKQTHCYSGSRKKLKLSVNLSYYFGLFLRRITPTFISNGLKKHLRKKGKIFLSDQGLF